jgi:hypothetical protein
MILPFIEKAARPLSAKARYCLTAKEQREVGYARQYVFNSPRH